MNRIRVSAKNDIHRASLDQETMDSLYPSPKIDTRPNPPHAGIIEINWTDTTAIAYGTVKTVYSFAHGYDYAPGVIAVGEYSDSSRSVSNLLPLFGAGSVGLLLIDSDLRNVNIKYRSGDTTSVHPLLPFTARIRYYVFAERGKQ